MTGLLFTGLGAIVLGLNLLVIRRTLIIKDTPVENKAEHQLTILGVVIMFVGIIITFIGMARCISGSQEYAAILSTGSAVIAIGLSSLIATYGRGHERCIWYGAWTAIAIGILLFLIYFALPNIFKLIGVD